jgi:hypothetical protein
MTRGFSGVAIVVVIVE